MPVPPFVVELRRRVGHAPLWLSGAAAVILRDGAAGAEVLLVRRADTGEWTLVSGIVDPGEHPVTTLEREAKEEACVEIAVERMLWQGVSDPVTYDNGDVCQYLDNGFLARWRSGEPAVGDEECTDVGWFSVDALPEGTRASVAADVALALGPRRDVELRLPSRPRLQPPPEGVLLNDPDCGFCARTVGLLTGRGMRARSAPLSEEAIEGYHLDRARTTMEVPFVRPDGTVRYGPEAIADALRTVPGPWGWAGRVLGTPPVQLLARPVYRWVARHRHELPGGTASCRLPQA